MAWSYNLQHNWDVEAPVPIVFNEFHGVIDVEEGFKNIITNLFDLFKLLDFDL